MANVKFSKIPPELRDLRQWLCWKMEHRNGKPTKVPINPKTGERASTTDPATWGTFQEARLASERNGCSGIGFVFSDRDSFTGIDLDHVRDPETGKFEPWARGVIKRFDSYSELSQSGTGAHVIIRGKIPGDRRRSSKIEIYDAGRFFVMTGLQLAGTPGTLEDRQSVLNQIYTEHFGPDEGALRDEKADTVLPSAPVPLCDQELIKKARSANNGAAFSALWDGDWKRAGYSSQSEADAALLGMLRFWTGGDKSRSFDLFSESGLHREKWGREDYRKKTWAKIANGEVYSPRIASADNIPDVTQQTSDPWDKMMPFDEAAETPEFPVSVLPSPFRDFACEVAESRQIAVDVPSALILGAVAMATAKKFKVLVGETHWEPTNLFLLVLMEPGERKTGTFQEVLSPIENHERNLVERETPKIRKIEERRAVQDIRLKEVRRLAAKGKDSGDRARFEREAESLAAGLIEVLEPPRLIVGDCTQERLATLLAQNSGRLAQIDGEGASFFNVVGGRYTRGQTNFEIYLRGHAGDTLRVDRAGRATEQVREPALSCILAAQPAVLRGLLHRDIFRGQGLLARFLYSLPRGAVGTRMYQNRPVSQDVRVAYGLAIWQIFGLPDPRTPEHPEASNPLVICGEALDAWSKHADETERDLAPDRRLSHIRDWGAKLAGAAARIAGGLHVMHHHADEKLLEPIEPEILENAWAIARYFRDHALVAFDCMGAGPNDILARRALEWIRRHHLQNFRLADCYDALRRGMDASQKSKDLLPAMEILAERNFIRDLPEPDSRGPGRRPSPAYEVNPAALGGRV